MYEFIRSAVAIQVIAAAGAAAALMAVLMFQRSRRAAGKDVPIGGTLRRPESRIRAMARLGQDKPAGAADQLEPYWYSKDPDERYFSLYFSSACADGPPRNWSGFCFCWTGSPLCGARPWAALPTAACPAPSTACRTSPCTTRPPPCGSGRPGAWPPGAKPGRTC